MSVGKEDIEFWRKGIPVWQKRMLKLQEEEFRLKEKEDHREVSCVFCVSESCEH